MRTILYAHPGRLSELVALCDDLHLSTTADPTNETITLAPGEHPGPILTARAQAVDVAP